MTRKYFYKPLNLELMQSENFFVWVVDKWYNLSTEHPIQQFEMFQKPEKWSATHSLPMMLRYNLYKAKLLLAL